MALSDALSLFADTRDLIANTWQFFVSVHMAIFAVLLLSPKTEAGPRPQILFLIPFYTGFMWLNYGGQQDNYALSGVLLQQIQALETQAGGPALISGVFQGGWVLQYLNAIYAGSFLFCTILIVVFALFGGKRAQAESA